MKSPKIDKDYYNKNYTEEKEKRFNITNLEDLTGVNGLAVGTSLSLTGVGSTAGVPIASSSAFKVFGAGLTSNQLYSILKKRFTNLKSWLNLITILCEKTLFISLKDKKTDERK